MAKKTSRKEYQDKYQKKYRIHKPKSARATKEYYNFWKSIENLTINELEGLFSIKKIKIFQINADKKITIEEKQKLIKILRTELIIINDVYKNKNSDEIKKIKNKEDDAKHSVNIASINEGITKKLKPSNYLSELEYYQEHSDFRKKTRYFDRKCWDWVTEDIKIFLRKNKYNKLSYNNPPRLKDDNKCRMFNSIPREIKYVHIEKENWSYFKDKNVINSMKKPIYNKNDFYKDHFFHCKPSFRIDNFVEKDIMEEMANIQTDHDFIDGD